MRGGPIRVATIDEDAAAFVREAMLRQEEESRRWEEMIQEGRRNIDDSNKAHSENIASYIQERDVSIVHQPLRTVHYSKVRGRTIKTIIETSVD